MKVRRRPWGLVIAVIVLGFLGFSLANREAVPDLAGKRVGLAIGGWIDPSEYGSIKSALASYKADVVTLGPTRASVPGLPRLGGGEFTVDRAFGEVIPDELDALIVVGDQSLASDPAIAGLLKAMYAKGRIVGSSAGGTLALAATGLLADKKVAVSAVAQEYGGVSIGKAVPEPVVIDDRLITSLLPSHGDQLAKGLAGLLRESR